MLWIMITLGCTNIEEKRLDVSVEICHLLEDCRLYESYGFADNSQCLVEMHDRVAAAQGDAAWADECLNSLVQQDCNIDWANTLIVEECN